MNSVHNWIVFCGVMLIICGALIIAADIVTIRDARKQPGPN